MKRFLLIVLLACAIRTASARSLTNVSYDPDYDLFYQEQYHQLAPKVQELIPRAYERILQLWGLQDIGGLRHSLVVQIKQVPSDTLQKWEAAYVQARGRGDSLKQVLVVDIGTYMQHPDEDLRTLLTHEMAHVLIMDVTTGSGAAPIPAWFNEGLAQSTTREGRHRTENDVDNLMESGVKPVLCDLDGPVDEFAHGPFNGSCYPEFYLAVQRLKQRGGERTIQRVIQGLHEGTKMPDLVASITGMDWPAFKQDAETYTAQVLEGVKPVP